MNSFPESLAWRHVDARDGFEVAFCRMYASGISIRGHTVAVENGSAWSVQYEISLDTDSHIESVSVTSMSASGTRSTELVLDADRGWVVDGARVPRLDGCIDVDLEASALTNAFPVRRLNWVVGQSCDVPAAYVRSPSLEVERLDQRYTLLEAVDGITRYEYFAPAFDLTTELTYDAASFVIDYPGLAVRIM